MRLRVAVAAILLACGGACMSAPGAAAQPSPLSGVYAPLDQPGPPLDVPAATLQAALSCTAGVQHAARNPILLVPGTALDPGSNFAWNYERAFQALQWPYCAITLPEHGMADIQVAGEYLVYALRTESAMAGRRVDILGFSQGGMVPRWALRFWPDTRALVGAFVGIDPSNHGTLDSQVACTLLCPPSFWQQATASNFISALNSDTEVFDGIAYTVVYSRADEIVTPNLDAEGSSSLEGGAEEVSNIAVQDICPADVSDHLAMGSYDPVAYALAVDAFIRTAPADPARISRSVCLQAFQPGVDAATFAADYTQYLAAIGSNVARAPEVAAEPPLAPYVFAGSAP